MAAFVPRVDQDVKRTTARRILVVLHIITYFPLVGFSCRLQNNHCAIDERGLEALWDI